jgi:hypothetical protein
MYFLTDEGIDYLIDKINQLSKSQSAKLEGDIYNVNVKFTFESALSLNAVKINFNKLSIEYKSFSQYNNHHIYTKLDQLSKLVPPRYWQEERAWKAGNKYIPTKNMEHQHLSNSVHLLELLIQNNKLTQEASEEYMENLQSSVVPELKERFNGELLSYIPYYSWEKDLIQNTSDHSK